jgi:hypothetical protein
VTPSHLGVHSPTDSFNVHFNHDSASHQSDDSAGNPANATGASGSNGVNANHVAQALQDSDGDDHLSNRSRTTERPAIHDIATTTITDDVNQTTSPGSGSGATTTNIQDDTANALGSSAITASPDSSAPAANTSTQSPTTNVQDDSSVPLSTSPNDAGPGSSATLAPQQSDTPPSETSHSDTPPSETAHAATPRSGMPATGKSDVPGTIDGTTSPTGDSVTPPNGGDVLRVMPVVTAGPESFIAVDTTFQGSGTFVDSRDDVFTVTVDFGDGSGVHSVTYDAAHSFTLSNVFTTEGTYSVVVAVSDSVGDVGTSSFYVHVFVATPTEPARVIADPGATTNATSGNIDVALTRSSAATTSGSLVVTQLPVDNANSVGLVVTTTDPSQGPAFLTAAKFDLRAVNLGEQDTAAVTFTVFSPSGLPPQLNVVDPATGALVPVQGSTAVADSLTITQVAGDPSHYHVRVVFDNTSQPRLDQLHGTVFTLTVPTTPPASPNAAPSELLLASIAAANSAVAQPRFEVSFSRGGVSSGSETTAATVAALATQVIAGGGEYLTLNTAFVRDMVFDSYRAFGDIADPRSGTILNNQPQEDLGDDAGPPAIDGAFETGAADIPPPAWLDTPISILGAQALANDELSWIAA